jgi:hypothetical protein
MVRIPDLTLSGLFDRVEDVLGRTAVGRTSVAPRAWAADAAGTITVFGFPAPADDADGEALGAILAAEMRRRGAVMCVVALEGWAADPERHECVALEGMALGGEDGPGPLREVRVLEILRRGRKIAGLRRLAPEGGAPEAHAEGAAGL